MNRKKNSNRTEPTKPGKGKGERRMGSIAGELCQWAVVDRGERHRAGVWMHDQRHLATAEWKHLHAGEPLAGWRVRRVWFGDPLYRTEREERR